MPSPSYFNPFCLLGFMRPPTAGEGRLGFVTIVSMLLSGLYWSPVCMGAACSAVIHVHMHLGVIAVLAGHSLRIIPGEAAAS